MAENTQTLYVIFAVLTLNRLRYPYVLRIKACVYNQIIRNTPEAGGREREEGRGGTGEGRSRDLTSEFDWAISMY